jgi:hypothetical protein
VAGALGAAQGAANPVVLAEVRARIAPLLPQKQRSGMPARIRTGARALIGVGDESKEERVWGGLHWVSAVLWSLYAAGVLAQIAFGSLHPIVWFALYGGAIALSLRQLLPLLLPWQWWRGRVPPADWAIWPHGLDAGVGVWLGSRLQDQALLAAASVLAVPEPERALGVARAIHDAKVKSRVLSGIASSLPEPLRAQALAEAQGATRAIDGVTDQDWIWTGAGTLLPQTLRGRTLAGAGAAAPEDGNAASQSRPAWDHTVEEALTAARVISDAGSRARTLAELAPLLPQRLREQAVAEAMAAARAIDDARSRIPALAAVAPLLLTCPTSTLYTLWRDTFRSPSIRSREDVLEELDQLFIATVHLSSGDGIQEIIAAIQDVGRWWP